MSRFTKNKCAIRASNLAVEVTASEAGPAAGEEFGEEK